MYTFGNKSKENLKDVFPLLVNILNKVLETDDFSVDQGGRTEAQQWEAFNSGHSKVHPPDGNHLIKKLPGMDREYAFAVDICPYLNGKRLATDEKNFGPYQMAQFAWFLRKVKCVGEELLKDTGWKLRFGIDWDSDMEILTDQTFQDWFHVEIIKQ